MNVNGIDTKAYEVRSTFLFQGLDAVKGTAIFCQWVVTALCHVLSTPYYFFLVQCIPLSTVHELCTFRSLVV